MLIAIRCMMLIDHSRDLGRGIKPFRRVLMTSPLYSRRKTFFGCCSVEILGKLLLTVTARNYNGSVEYQFIGF
jgi:hypothetical protein